MAILIQIALALWIFLSVLNAVGGLIGWFQLRTDRRRASLYLSRILIATSFRNMLTFVGLYQWSHVAAQSPIYVAFSLLAAVLLCGAIWGWLFYLRGIWNGGGWRDLIANLRRPDGENKSKGAR